MGFFDSLTSFIPFSTPVDAEAATSSDDAAKDESGEEADANKQDAVKGASGGDDEAEESGGDDEPAAEEEEEEEEEPEDRKEALEEGEFTTRGGACGWFMQLLTVDGCRMRQFEAMQAAQDALRRVCSPRGRAD
jgi:hypothetical protein